MREINIHPILQFSHRKELKFTFDGKTMRTFEEVKSVTLKNGLIQSVKDIKVERGLGAKKIAQMAGINLPVQNFRHQIAVSEPLEDFLNPMVVKGELYFTQTHRGRIIGGTDMEEEPSENLNSNINFLEKYAREVVDTLPTLSSVKIMRQWASSYVVSPDHHPILGSQEIPNLIMGCGYSGHGFMLGLIVGKLLAGYIKNGNFFLEEANHLTVERFKTGKLIHEKTVIG